MLSVVLLAVLGTITPSRTWYPPQLPVTVKSDGQAASRLLLTDFSARKIEGNQPAQIEPGGELDLSKVYPALRVGTYLLYNTIPGKDETDFEGTPLVISVRGDTRPGAAPGPMTVKVEPLRYAVMHTDFGDVTMAFYYDVAPNTVTSFLDLAKTGYYDGLTFHRIIPGFVLQGGDPRGDGTGGPGYQIDAEFSGRPHQPGVLSMARQGDPLEQQGAMPRAEFADSAGSQFFICLDYNRTRKLDGRYTAFGIITDGWDAVNKMAQVPIADAKAGRPAQPPKINKVEVLDVTAANNPYKVLIEKLIAPPGNGATENTGIAQPKVPTEDRTQEIPARPQ